MLNERPHLDLLGPARKIWRYQLESRTLTNVSEQILKIKRSAADVPGSQVPWLYHQYLQSGDPRPLIPVFIHNETDVLCMPILMTEIMVRIERPRYPAKPLERLGMARWAAALNDPERAERELATALEQSDHPQERTQLLRELALLYKKGDRRATAEPLWQELVNSTGQERRIIIEASVELAKFYEWHQIDLALALEITERAIALFDSDLYHPDLVDLNHRRQRLIRKSRSV